MRILLTNRAYDILKWVCLIALPALAALLTAVGEIWSVPEMPRIVMTLNAVTAFLGAMIGLSTSTYNKTLQ